MSAKPRPTARLLAELVLIVFGVLVALQLEALRDARETRERTAAHLLALQDDIEENRARLRGSIDALERAVEAGRDLQLIANGHERIRPVAEMVELVSSSVSYSRLEPVTGAYDALVASGDLRFVPGADLRSAIANFVSVARQPHEAEQLGTIVRTEVIGALSESTSLLSVMDTRLRTFADLPTSSGAPDFDALLVNQRYLSQLALLTTTEAGIAGVYRQLELEATRIIELIETARAAL